MILLIDNYDSFSYNLYQLVGEITEDIKVVRNDSVSIQEIEALNPEKIILSPGPGRPEDAGIIVECVKKLSNKIPILGVCLGHQAICAAFGGKIVHAPNMMHGKQSEVVLDRICPLFKNCPEKALVARYHSLIAEKDSLPTSLHITASAESGEIMAVQHRNLPVFGLQFHPESVMTPEGKKILQNFIDLK